MISASCWRACSAFPVVVLCATAMTFGADTITLSSPRIGLTIGAGSGALQAIDNKLTGSRNDLRDVAFQLSTTRGELTPHTCQVTGTRFDNSLAVFRFAGQGLEVELQYQVVSESGAVRKLLRICNQSGEAVTLTRIALFNWSLPVQWPTNYSHSYNPDGVNEVYFHRSGIWYDHSINLFLRDDSGGLFVGIENPFFEANYWSLRKVYPTRVEVSYRPQWILNHGETFESDAGFLGAYRHEGIYAVPPQRSYFSGRERMRLAILDWGEVWAMQEYMRSIMPLMQTGDGSYYMSYWGKADPSVLGQISRMNESGKTLTPEQRAMLKHFGGGPFPFSENELWYRLTPDSVRFYKQVVDDAAWLGHFGTVVIPNMMAGHSGWFESPEQKQDPSVKTLTDTWFHVPAFRLWQEIADYAAAKGIGMFTLELAGRDYRQDRPDWKYQDADGTRSAANCYANRAYVDWYTSQVDQALTVHPIKHWQWDEGWMDVLRGMIGEEAHCYAEDHGHPPGNVSYHQFRNVEHTLRTLKQHHPEVRLVIISGLIRGMPWIMKHLDADSHTGADAWTDNNVYFLPPSRSHRQGGLHWILDNFSAGVEPSGIADWYSMLEDSRWRAEYRQKWDRWVSWANGHQEFLERRRDLFHQSPKGGGLEGTVHAKGQAGFLFLHNSNSETEVGEIPLSSWLGLEFGERFRVRQLYPQEQEFGVYAWKDALLVPVPSEATVLLELTGDSRPIDRRLPQPPGGAKVRKAFLNLDEVFALIEANDLWPAKPLPGTKEMPEF